MHAWCTSLLLLLHSTFILSVVKMLLKGVVGGCALNSHGNYIVDHGKSWKSHGIEVLNFSGNLVSRRSRKGLKKWRGYCFLLFSINIQIAVAGISYNLNWVILDGFCRLSVFIQLFRKILSGIQSKLNSLVPDQARHFVRPGLGPNCLQSLSAEDSSRQTVKTWQADKRLVDYLITFEGFL